MNKQLIKQWVDTLRSGKYQQGLTVLKSIDNKFCCLGVLCDIAKHLIYLDWELEDSDDMSYKIQDTCTVLPEDLINLLGVNSSRVLIMRTNSKLQEYLGNEEIATMSRHTTLVTLNDYYKLSFNQIADILEEEFLHEAKTTNLA